ncbi:ABC transporter permease [Paenibacillus sp. N1-5-1-14]|nr:ABC transporter permease [Paenibacillus radicibacter]MCR8642598.1 ABC transporter permease [Paenibacillus radicibacter]
MSNFFPLVQNENMKIYRRPRNWIMAGFIVLALILFTVLMHISSPVESGSTADWKPQLTHQMEENKKLLADPEVAEFVKKRFEDEIKVGQYQLEHNINPYEQTAWSTVKELSLVISLVSIFTIVVAADMIAAEFTWGTVKLLLIRPASRLRILISKYTATLIFALFLTLITFIVSFIIGAATNGFTGFSTPEIYVGADGAVHERLMILSVLKTYGFSLVSTLMYVTFAFMVSSAFRSSSMAIALSLVGMLVGNTVVSIFQKYEWSKYILFANTDLKSYFDGTPFRPEMTLSFSITILAIYFVVFHIVAWLMFTKRDVAA